MFTLSHARAHVLTVCIHGHKLAHPLTVLRRQRADSKGQRLWTGHPPPSEAGGDFREHGAGGQDTGAVTGDVAGLSLSLWLLDEERDHIVTEVSLGTQI